MYNTLHKAKIFHILSRHLLTEDFLPFKLVYKLIKKLNWSKKVRLNGKDYTILIRNGTGIMNFISGYEIWLDDILPKLIKKDDAVFIDVGANVGQTMLKVLSKFPQIRYFGVEPNHYCVSYLKDLAEVNNFNSVKILECGLSDGDGGGELLLRYQDDILATTSHSFRKFTKYAIKQSVQMTTGDALLGNVLDEISVIKIDVEGGEAKVIDGFINTIKAFQPYILCEILPIISPDEDVTTFRKTSANQLFASLSNLNYIAINISTKVIVANLEDLSPSLESSNYLFLPENKIHFLKEELL